MNEICQYIEDGFEQAISERCSGERRIGSELKFPLVNADGTVVSYEVIQDLWRYLEGHCGWTPVIDSVSGKTVGAKVKGEQNHTVASCETGYCKTEFSLAHVSNLFDLQEMIDRLRERLQKFSEENNVYFLGYGIQPVTPPSQRLLMKKSRSGVWDMFNSNEHIDEKDGDDMHLFTINAASHVHVTVSPEESVKAVNVLNGFSGAQIALTADSNIWRNQIDEDYKCVAEKFWDWWISDENRIGVPEKPFEDLEDYVDTIAGLKPVFVKREGKPIVLCNHDSFEDYFTCDKAVGIDANGKETEITPEEKDIDVHSTCYWYNARLSHYYTVENRVCDQQPPEDLVCIPAMTLGLVSALDEAHDEIEKHDWELLKDSREAACEKALQAKAGDTKVAELAEKMLDIASRGLEKRGLGEEKFLAPLEKRLIKRSAPADQAAEVFSEGGAEALVKDRAL